MELEQGNGICLEWSHKDQLYYAKWLCRIGELHVIIKENKAEPLIWYNDYIGRIFKVLEILEDKQPVKYVVKCKLSWSKKTIQEIDFFHANLSPRFTTLKQKYDNRRYIRHYLFTCSNTMAQKKRCVTCRKWKTYENFSKNKRACIGCSREAKANAGAYDYFWRRQKLKKTEVPEEIFEAKVNQLKTLHAIKELKEELKNGND